MAREKSSGSFDSFSVASAPSNSLKMRDSSGLGLPDNQLLHTWELLCRASGAHHFLLSSPRADALG